MKKVFADTGYWIAILDPRDELHAKAKSVSRELGEFQMITSEMVLVELLNFFAELGTEMRRAAVEAISAIARNVNMTIVPQTSIQFKNAVDR